MHIRRLAKWLANIAQNAQSKFDKRFVANTFNRIADSRNILKVATGGIQRRRRKRARFTRSVGFYEHIIALGTVIYYVPGI